MTGGLRVGDQQLVEIAKHFRSMHQCVMDEPKCADGCGSGAARTNECHIASAGLHNSLYLTQNG